MTSSTHPTRHLLLLRHGNAENLAGDDHARPLSRIGKSEVGQAARNVSSLHVCIDVAYVSSAERTQQTAAQLMQLGVFTDDMMYSDAGLYLASAQELLTEVQLLDDAHHCVLIIGHNPGIYELAALLSGKDHADALMSGLPTCGLIHLRFDNAHWDDICAHSSVHTAMVRPS